MKSYEKEIVLEGLYSAILSDCRNTYPDDHPSLDLDESRLLALGRNRGLGFYTLDLPAMGKCFDIALSKGFLPLSKVPGFGALSKGSTIPKLFSGMWLKVFDHSGMLRSEPDINAILFLRQLLYAAKKLRITCDEKRTFDAVKEFFRIEAELRLPSLRWDEDDLGIDHSRDLHLADSLRVGDNPGFQPASTCDDLFASGSVVEPPPSLLDTIQQVADIVSSSLGWFDPLEWKTKHGPGAVADQKSGKSKYAFPTWPAKLEAVFPLADFAFANLSMWADAINNESVVSKGFSLHEPPARLIAVPKTQKGPRLIASEPTSHQWAQQAINDFLRSMVAESPIGPSISFRSQESSRDFALRASLSESHSTIDLSSASDRLSCWLVERMFRRNITLLRALHASRTRYLINEISDKSPKYVVLKKLAPQGAAFTFPIQTYVYSCIVIGTMLHAIDLPVTPSSIWRMARETRTFGDDMIVPKGVGETVIQVLEHLGFQVNRDKTFSTGKFRESCGMDAFAGYDVTPAYFLESYDRTRPGSVSSVIDASNNFYKKGFWCAASWIESTLPGHILKNMPVVRADAGAFGLASFTGNKVDHLKKRWNPNLHVEEVFVTRVKARVTKLQDEGESALLQYFTEDPSPDIIWESGIAQRPESFIRPGWVPISQFYYEFRSRK
ncbi:MAG: putative replicase protein [Leviviridae sp.]|nr:MAG: putative replicase protein [Leviviridae sp.]